MTAKEYAVELQSEMKSCLYSDGKYDAKQCAVIAVRRIKEALISYGEDSDELQNMDCTLRWYDKVEDELCNL